MKNNARAVPGAELGVNGLYASFLVHIPLWTDGVNRGYPYNTHTFAEGNVSPGVAPQNTEMSAFTACLQSAVCGVRVRWYANRVPK